MALRIKGWSEHFENNRTRELKNLRGFILPNKLDGDGYTELVDHPQGAAHYAVWISILQVASKGEHPAGGCGIPAGCCECRGILLREGDKAHDSASLSRITRLPKKLFDDAIPRLVSIGWLEVSEIPQEGAEKCEIDAEKCPLSKDNISKDKEREIKTTVRATRLPDDFTLSDSMRDWAKTETPHVDLNRALSEFVDYWRGVPGSRGTKLDWPATWRNRMRELENRAPQNGNGRPLSKAERTQQAVENVVRRYERGES